jgi:hypothetical protein
LVIVANANAQTGWQGEVIVDLASNSIGASYLPIFSNKTLSTSDENGGAALASG